MTKCHNHKLFFPRIKGGTQTLLDIITTVGSCPLPQRPAPLWRLFVEGLVLPRLMADKCCPIYKLRG